MPFTHIQSARMNQKVHIYASSTLPQSFGDDTPRSTHHQLTGRILMDFIGMCVGSLLLRSW